MVRFLLRRSECRCHRERTVMSKPKQKKTRATIFRIFLFPLIAIMLLQGVITVGTLVV